MSKFMKTIGLIIGVIVAIGLVGFILIQLVPVDRSNPAVVSEPKWDSPQTKTLVERACYDCHSNQTKWPWYSWVAPVSWLVADDVHEARSRLNFTDPNSGEGIEPEDLISEIESNGMPPQKYLLMHPEARLTDAEKSALITGLQATFGSGGEGGTTK